MNKKISLKEAISIGIGGMVGGGIFAVLGLAVSLAKGGTPIAFLFAGIIALLTSYSYVKLSLTFPDRGGTVKFINEGFGISFFSGGINNLLWISYIIMLSLYASAFGSYAPNLYEITSDKAINFHIYASGIILFATAINYYSNELPRGRAIEVSSGKNFIFSLMKTSGFQTFLFDHRGRASGNSFD